MSAEKRSKARNASFGVPTCSYAEQECLPFFEPGHAPWGYEDVADSSSNANSDLT